MFKEVIGVESTRQETVKPDQLDMETKANRNYRKWNKFLFDFMYLLNKQFCLFIFREGEGREKERERNISVCLLFTCPPLRTWPATQACALTGNRTSNALVRRPALNPLNYTSQGNEQNLFKNFCLWRTRWKSLVQTQIWWPWQSPLCPWPLW